LDYYLYVIQHCFICFRLYCVGECWDRTQKDGMLGSNSEMLGSNTKMLGSNPEMIGSNMNRLWIKKRKNRRISAEKGSGHTTKNQRIMEISPLG
jgi:hypothetical protein